MYSKISKKFVALIIFLLLLSGCYTKIKYPKQSTNSEIIIKQPNETKKNIVVINENNSFYITIEDLARNGYKFGHGSYYMFDFENYSYIWNDISDLLADLIQNDIRPTDIWFQGGSSSCVDFKTGTAFHMIVKPKLLIRLDYHDHTLTDLGFITTYNTRFFCPYHISHYSRAENEFE